MIMGWRVMVELVELYKLARFLVSGEFILSIQLTLLISVTLAYSLVSVLSNSNRGAVIHSQTLYSNSMPNTLVTGANGFVAASILDELIKNGHKVTGSVRSPSKGQQILDTHPDWEGQLDFVTVSDYSAAGTWDSAFQSHDFDYVIHTAAPLLDDPRLSDFVKDFLNPSVDGYGSFNSLSRAMLTCR